MFPADTDGVRSETGPVCCVASDAGRLTFAPPAGRVIQILDVETAVRAEPLIAEIHESPVADRSECIRRALEKLHGHHHFAEIHFPSLGGLGFRTIQARNSGLAFTNTRIVFHSDSSSKQERESRQSWPAGPDDLILDYMEQYCAANVSREAPQQTQPLVTVGIAHYNLGAFLPAALESLAKQTYSNIEIIVIDDGSTQPDSIAAIHQLEREYPQTRFLKQSNAGIGATRNRLLAEARGEYFIPMDADNLARPEMVETFVRGLSRNPECSAMTCYFRAFNESPDSPIYAYRPTGGPHVLSCIRNVYGDANGIFRTADFRAVGGYETDRGTSCEDWEAYVKLIHAGKRVDVIPEYLFDYRHRESGFSRATNWFANHQRVMRQFQGVNSDAAWTAMLGFQQENLRLNERLRSPRYRVADAIHESIAKPYRWLKRRFTSSSA